MTLPLDLMLGDTGPEQAAKECRYKYVEWINDSGSGEHMPGREANCGTQTEDPGLCLRKRDQ